MLMFLKLFRILKTVAASKLNLKNLSGKEWKLLNCSRYFLMTTLSNQVNEELPVSRYRPVNLFRAPFYLPTPVCVAKDTIESAGMYAMLSEAATIN